MSDTQKKSERKSLQVTINVLTGQSDVNGLALFTQLNGPPPHRDPTFTVSEAEFYFRREVQDDNISAISKVTIDRYSGIMREAQMVVSLKANIREPFFITGEYNCKRLEKRAF